ncbi:MAG TPA: hypothetical protein VN726_08735 [Hanamia sp.]|jgi:hypothetical protein|nr:hypothetical protein [Hanamia sp.]
MSDNANDRSLVTPINTPSENPPEEIIPINETEIIVPNQQIENMEVHHHAHHEGKKSWKSYAWEFLMLFFAVFCGFLAQNFLEHRLEKERGNQYVRSMIEDIVSDSTKINQTFEFTKKQQLALDSLSALFYNPPYSDSTIKRMYILMLKYTMNEANVTFTKRTVSQLKNSGGMRLIPNKISADEITKYIEGAEAIESQGDYFKNIALGEIIKLNNQIFYLKYTKGVTRKNIDDFMMKAPVKLANHNANLLIEYSNQLFFTSGLLINYNNKITDFKSEILQTIEILKKENHID